MVCDKFEQCMTTDDYKCHNKKVDCLEYRDQRKICVCEEKKMRYQLENDIGAIVSKYHIDGGVVQNDDGINRCDFLVVACNDLQGFMQIFVELKGTDVVHAMEQLKTSIDQFKIRSKACSRIRAVCVSKNVPNIQNNPKGNALRKYFIANMVQFEQKSVKAEEKLSKIW